MTSAALDAELRQFDEMRAPLACGTAPKGHATLGQELQKTGQDHILHKVQERHLLEAKACWFLAAASVFFIRKAMVIGPTPPGTGVTADATVSALS